MKVVDFFYFFCFSHAFCDQKLWKFDNDVTNPSNWEVLPKSERCKGLIFPDVLSSIGSISQIKTNEILLPVTGEFELQNGGYIEFSSAEEDQKCVRVKDIVARRWLDPRNWDFGENSARPDVEKVPCTYDDAIFPEKDAAVFYPETSVTVKSVQIKHFKLTDNGVWQNFLASDYGVDQFHGQETMGDIKIVGGKCASSSGCVCHDNQDVQYWVCKDVPKNDAPQCSSPIRPYGFCGDICGGVVYLHVTPKFSLVALRKYFPKMVDVYASKVEEKNALVQVTFAEPLGYTEKSAQVAQEFYQMIISELEQFKVINASLATSGIRLPLGSQSSIALGIVFGTLLSVAAIFATIYIVYLGPLKNYTFKPSFLIGEQRLYTEMSRATSLVSLEKSFDNPLYGTTIPSTSTGNMKDENETPEKEEEERRKSDDYDED